MPIGIITNTCAILLGGIVGALGAVWGRVWLDRGADSATGADSVRGWTVKRG